MVANIASILHCHIYNIYNPCFYGHSLYSSALPTFKSSNVKHKITTTRHDKILYMHGTTKDRTAVLWKYKSYTVNGDNNNKDK